MRVLCVILLLNFPCEFYSQFTNLFHLVRRYIEIGSVYQNTRHDVAEIRVDPSLPDNSGTIVECIASGVVDREGDIIRKAKVVIGKKEDVKTEVSAQQATDTISSSAQEENAEEEIE